MGKKSLHSSIRKSNLLDEEKIWVVQPCLFNHLTNRQCNHCYYYVWRWSGCTQSGGLLRYSMCFDDDNGGMRQIYMAIWTVQECISVLFRIWRYEITESFILIRYSRLRLYSKLVFYMKMIFVPRINENESWKIWVISPTDDSRTSFV